MKRLNWLFASLSLFVVFGCGGPPSPVDDGQPDQASEPMSEEEIESEREMN